MAPCMVVVLLSVAFGICVGLAGLSRFLYGEPGYGYPQRVKQALECARTKAPAGSPVTILQITREESGLIGAREVELTNGFLGDEIIYYTLPQRGQPQPRLGNLIWVTPTASGICP